MKFSAIIVLLLHLCLPAVGQFSCQDIFLPQQISTDALSVLIKRENQTIVYARTNRGILELSTEHYGPKIMNLSRFKNKIVMDAGCGDGKFVEQLNKLGVQVFGLDLHLTEYQKSRPNLFLQKDLRQTELPGESVDFIFSTWSVISYEAGIDKSSKLVVDVLNEMNRVLAPGGYMYISPRPTSKLGSTLVHSHLIKLGLEVQEFSYGPDEIRVYKGLEIYKPISEKK
jgi:SAM-dependent methyltransferase